MEHLAGSQRGRHGGQKRGQRSPEEFMQEPHKPTATRVPAGGVASFSSTGGFGELPEEELEVLRCKPLGDSSDKPPWPPLPSPSTRSTHPHPEPATPWLKHPRPPGRSPRPSPCPHQPHHCFHRGQATGSGRSSPGTFGTSEPPVWPRSPRRSPPVCAPAFFGFHLSAGGRWVGGWVGRWEPNEQHARQRLAVMICPTARAAPLLTSASEPKPLNYTAECTHPTSRCLCP